MNGIVGSSLGIVDKTWSLNFEVLTEIDFLVWGIRLLVGNSERKDVGESFVKEGRGVRMREVK